MSEQGAVSLAEAKARLSELVERAIQGEPVRITRRGKPVVQIVAIPTARPPLDLEAMQRLTESLPLSEVDAGTFVRRMRDSDRD